MRSHQVLYPLIAVIVIFATPNPSHADSLQQERVRAAFENQHSEDGGGTPHYNGGATPFSDGFDVLNFDQFTGYIGGVANAEISLVTGNFSGSDPSHWFFDGGGSFSEDGFAESCDPSGNNCDSLDFSVTGSFLSASISWGSFDVTFRGTFAATVNGDLLKFAGLPEGPYVGTLEYAFAPTEDFQVL